jgi:hypothetical protein
MVVVTTRATILGLFKPHDVEKCAHSLHRWVRLLVVDGQCTSSNGRVLLVLLCGLLLTSDTRVLSQAYFVKTFSTSHFNLWMTPTWRPEPPTLWAFYPVNYGKLKYCFLPTKTDDVVWRWRRCRCRPSAWQLVVDLLWRFGGGMFFYLTSQTCQFSKVQFPTMLHMSPTRHVVGGYPCRVAATCHMTCQTFCQVSPRHVATSRLLRVPLRHDMSRHHVKGPNWTTNCV